MVIPTYNRADHLKHCLISLLKQEVDTNWEIVVVDDGSHTDMRLVIDSLDHGGLIRYHRQKNQGPAKARNTGVALAKGTFIAFIDDDCRAEPHWLSTHLKHVKPGIMIGGRIENKIKESVYSEASQLLVSFLFTFFKDSSLYFFTTNNMSFDRQTFLDIGGFDEAFDTVSEDRELCLRWQQRGYKLQYVGEAIVGHHHALNKQTFKRLHQKYGTGDLLFRDKAALLGADVFSAEQGFPQALKHYISQLPGKTLFQKYRIKKAIMLSQACYQKGVDETRALKNAHANG